MRSDTEGNKLKATYRHSIFICHPGKNRMLEAVFDTPRLLVKALNAMRLHNPHRVYETDDPLIP